MPPLSITQKTGSAATPVAQKPTGGIYTIVSQKATVAVPIQQKPDPNAVYTEVFQK